MVAASVGKWAKKKCGAVCRRMCGISYRLLSHVCATPTALFSLSVHIDTGTSLCAIDRVQTIEEEDDGEKKIGHDGIPHVAVVRVE